MVRTIFQLLFGADEKETLLDLKDLILMEFQQCHITVRKIDTEIIL